ncbi:MAG: hypothetical protein M1837_000730 [Sclerophora amabilis]|nr:MAG: hypothetical protein M1837_000730 [Sclerophora amabilis]
MATRTSGKYLVNDELTDQASMKTDLIKQCTFNVGPVIPVRTGNTNIETKDKTDPSSRQQHQKFIDITYPSGEKSKICVLPGVVMHYKIEEHYGKPSIFVGVPQPIVKELSLKLSNVGEYPLFQDKKIITSKGPSLGWWILTLTVLEKISDVPGASAAVKQTLNHAKKTYKSMPELQSWVR